MQLYYTFLKFCNQIFTDSNLSTLVIEYGKEFQAPLHLTDNYHIRNVHRHCEYDNCRYVTKNLTSGQICSLNLHNLNNSSHAVLVAYGSMGNSLVTNWKEDPTPAFLVSKRSKSHQFLESIAFCMNSQQTFRKKIYKRGHFKWLALQIDNFHGYFFSSFLSKVGLDSSILIVHALNTKRSFYPEKSHVKRAASVWFFC